MKFIEINDSTTINIDAITRIERLEMGKTMVIMPDASVIAEIPYDTMIGLLQNQDEIDREVKESSVGSMAESLNILTQGDQFTRV